ncbi:methylated-DNA--[protein]-cysteine S-methyltransferase [Caulobacter hibisci]|uniref:Bifunctional helix-turn-helix domain-containing protein/methylated-DNA--[protein]-cysteine S-methyltransferase n=1 Tax=Caulobacter hibisci TaxID=2035993 RepID=A0ABS0SUU5_9CAUL|nr:bifunctional helix-turn-helix domain-containing protein/methylated-DNA--[protein]-cysteine S-methyltransferase [Caulobacter hibisci]MBI1683417.1 bifunctional helix-turn-helix domain-containing protein/methylated-DNA--[protein]-cysteine S-methyltransferase [Caulobacter hibisci]
MPLDVSPSETLARLAERSADYHRMAVALDWLAQRWMDRPSLDEAAAAVGLSPFHFQRIFTRWAGVSPKTFVAAIAHAEARRSLEAGASVLDAAYDAGLSGPSRLHDLFIAQEAATPGDVRRRGAGMTLRWGWAPTPFGRGLFVLAERGLAGLAFSDGNDDFAFADMHRRWPGADWLREDAAAAETALRAFGMGEGPLPVVLIGSPYQVQVWKALLRIPAGETATYGQVAAWAGKPKAFQATGGAIGANPISLLIPCHRAIAKDGRLTGYHWGLARKAAILGMEAVAVQEVA